MNFRLLSAALVLLASSALGYDDFKLVNKASVVQKLLSKATVIEEKAARGLEDYGRQINFLHRYSIKYLGCTSIVQFNRKADGDFDTQHLVKFALCPSDEGCRSCSEESGGQYVIDMMQFVDAYTEAKLDEQEYQCEMVRENCYCNNYNDVEACENSCYKQTGMEGVCIEYKGQELFEIQRYMECTEMKGQNDNNNNDGNHNYNGNNFDGQQQYYIAPYCANDGASIHLGVFYDNMCMNRTDDTVDVYAEKNDGRSLPYSAQPLVTLDDDNCIPCAYVGPDRYINNNNDDDFNSYYVEESDVTEMCETSYYEAARCETNMGIEYPDTSGCTFIQDILPRMEEMAANHPYSMNHTISGGDGGGGASTTFAWLFGAFGLSTILVGAYACFLYCKINRVVMNCDCILEEQDTEQLTKVTEDDAGEQHPQLEGRDEEKDLDD